MKLNVYGPGRRSLVLRRFQANGGVCLGTLNQKLQRCPHLFDHSWLVYVAMYPVPPRMAHLPEGVTGAPARSASEMGQCAQGATMWPGPSVPSRKDAPTPISTAARANKSQERGTTCLIQLALSRASLWSWERATMFTYAVHSMVSVVGLGCHTWTWSPFTFLSATADRLVLCSVF
jgi:hypothetical protein